MGQALISDLEILQKYISKVIYHFANQIPSGTEFKKNTSLLIRGVLDSIAPLKEQIVGLYD